MQSWQWSGRSGKTTRCYSTFTGYGSPLRGVTSVSWLELYLVTTSAADGVGKRAAAQGLPARLFDPILEDKGRLKQCENVGPTKTWLCFSLRWHLGGRILVEAPTIAGGHAVENRSHSRSPSFYSVLPVTSLTLLKVPWFLTHPKLSWLFYAEEIQSLLAHPRVVAISRLFFFLIGYYGKLVL